MKKDIKPFSHEDKFAFQWRGPDHIKYKKGILWYIIAGIVLGIFLFYAYLEHSIVLAILTFTMALVYASFDKTQPQEVDIIISEMGIKIGKRQTLYEGLSSFHIEHYPPLHTIVLISKDYLHTEIIVPYPPQINPNDLKKYLKTKLPIHGLKQKRLIDSLIRIIKL